MKNKISDTAPDETTSVLNLTITPIQHARLFGEELSPQTRECLQGWCSIDGAWMGAQKREDGTWGIPIMFAPLLENRHGFFAEWMMRVVIEEVGHGHHTQESLDDVLNLCGELVPNGKGWVSAFALHTFLKEVESFSFWCAKIQYVLSLAPAKRHSHTKIRRSAESSPPTAFKVNAQLAFKIALSSPTPGEKFSGGIFSP